jgi:UDP-N-acetylmuramate--alanine ligase
MAALAVIAKGAGLVVTGSDVGEQFITDKTLLEAGIVPFVGFAPEHVNTAEVIVTTGAHGGYDNPEVVSAKEKGIRVLSLAEATGLFMSGELFGRKLTGVSVAGTHGKTTTTAMAATILRQNDMDPSFFIGTSDIPSLGSSGHFGKGDYFVVESDEYAIEPVYDKRAKFLLQHPQIAIITNIELDHPDIYPDVATLRNTFLQFANNNIAKDGVLITCGDDHEVQTLLKEYTGRAIRYGFGDGNDVVISMGEVGGMGEIGKTIFNLNFFGTYIGEFVTLVPGKHNVLNAVAAMMVGLEVGLSIDQVKKGILAFTGTKRRLEFKGTLDSGALLYDDYGHHPTEVARTLEAVRSMYPQKKIVTIFQPHTFSRTKVLFQQFVHCFTQSDVVILTDIFASAREEKDPTVSSQLLAEQIKHVHTQVLFLPKLEDVVKYLDEKRYTGDTVVITIGAGDVYKIGEKIVNYS